MDQPTLHEFDRLCQQPAAAKTPKQIKPSRET